MKCIIRLRRVKSGFLIGSLEDIPLKKVYMVGQYLHYDCDGNFISLQYALYIPDSNTYTVDLPDKNDWQEFTDWLTSKFESLGINPKVIGGTVQEFSGENKDAETL